MSAGDREVWWPYAVATVSKIVPEWEMRPNWGCVKRDARRERYKRTGEGQKSASTMMDR